MIFLSPFSRAGSKFTLLSGLGMAIFGDDFDGPHPRPVSVAREQSKSRANVEDANRT